MKTFILKTEDNSLRAELKVDLFARNSQLLEPGFDTRFTNMEIVSQDEEIKKGVNLQQTENNYQAIVNLASTTGLGLYVVDINGPGNSLVEIVAPSSEGYYYPSSEGVSEPLGEL